MVLLMVLAPNAEMYYVRMDGSNSNAGLTNSAGGAWSTIDFAADYVSAGDVIRVQPGTYQERVTPGVNGLSVSNTVTFLTEGSVSVCGFDLAGNNYLRIVKNQN